MIEFYIEIFLGNLFCWKIVIFNKWTIYKLFYTQITQWLKYLNIQRVTHLNINMKFNKIYQSYYKFLLLLISQIYID